MDDAELRQVLNRLNVLERKVSDLYSTLGNPEPALEQLVNPDEDEQIILLVQQGKNMDAVKRYRELSGLGLAESVSAVENLAALYNPTG